MEATSKIIKQCLKGDQGACKELYQSFMPYAIGICRRYGVVESNLKDQVQIIFSSMFKSLNNFDASKASFKTWFTHICVNKVLEQRKKIKPVDYQENWEDIERKFAFDDSNLIHDKLDRMYILKILHSMPVKFQAVFNMYIMEEFSHKEIADKLGISEGSSRVILKRAREWAKEAISKLLITEDYE